MLLLHNGAAAHATVDQDPSADIDADFVSAVGAAVATGPRNDSELYAVVAAHSAAQNQSVGILCENCVSLAGLRNEQDTQEEAIRVLNERMGVDG